jgi:hypothetical protein
MLGLSQERFMMSLEQSMASESEEVSIFPLKGPLSAHQRDMEAHQRCS